MTQPLIQTAAPLPLLRVRQLCKTFGGVHAVEGVSFDLQAGEMLALIGPNGAGKSTTFNLLNGQLKADSGDVLMETGTSLLGLKPRQIQRLGVGRTFQITRTFGSLTVLENVQTACLAQAQQPLQWGMRPLSRTQVAAQTLLEKVGLGAFAHLPSQTLSYGDQKRLELAMVLAGNPRLLLMDEPTAGMALEERLALMTMAKELAQERRMGVLFTEHNLEVVFGFADRVAVMAAGRLVALDSPAAVQANPQVQSLYLTPTLKTTTTTTSTTTPITAFASVTSGTSKPKSRTCLEVHDLWAGYGPAQVIRGLSLTVQSGEVVALMGRNGAGKSTTLKALMGMLGPRHGTMTLLGQPIPADAPPHRLAQQGLGYVPEERRIFTDLSVLENLQLAVSSVSQSGPARHTDPSHSVESTPWNLERVFAVFPLLLPLQHRPAGLLSGGEQQILTVARTLMGNPQVLLLDEPSEGVAPQVVAQMAEVIQTLKSAGVGILLCEQNAAFTALVADRHLWLDNGVLHAQTAN